MAPEKRSMGEDRVQAALDLCLARMRRGESLERCLLDFADLADDLRPLLILARDLNTVREASVPAPATGLMPGRERFLAAAREQRAAEQAAASAEAEAIDALDLCLARVTAGVPVERALAAYPAALAEELRPLVEGARALAATPPAPPPRRLAEGRARFLAAAGMAASGALAAAGVNGKNGHAAYPGAGHAGAEPPEVDPALVEALDDCLARIRAGERADLVLAGLPMAVADALRPLVAAAGGLMDAVQPAPPPPGGLAAGRARFLDVAARAEAHRAAVAGAQATAALTMAAASQAGWRARVESWTAGWASGARVPALLVRSMAAATMAVALFFGAAVMVRDNAAVAGALPGEPAYLIKRLNEQIDLLTTFDPNQRVQIEREHDLRRAAEVQQLIALGREAEVALRGAFLGFEVERLADGSTRILLRLRIPPTGADAREQVIVLGDQAALDLADYARIEDLPPGAVISLTVHTGRGAGDRAVARQVQLVGVPEVLANIPPPAPAAPTEVLRVVPATLPPSVPALPSAAPATTSAVLPDQPGTPTATDLPPPATPTATMEATAAPAAGQGEVEQTTRKVRGVVIAQPAAAVWMVGRDGCNGTVVRVDISRVPEHVGTDVLFKSVYVSGKYLNDEETEFAASLVRDVRDYPGLTESAVDGKVVAHPGDGTLLLDNGRSYRIDTATTHGEVKVGALVTVHYRSCGDGMPVALEVTVRGDQPESRNFEGRVADLIPNTSFTLINEGQDPEMPERVTVHFDAGTLINGVASSVENGQWVFVSGNMTSDNVLHAALIAIRELANPLGGDQGDPPPLVTLAPTPMPTPTPGTTSNN